MWYSRIEDYYKKGYYTKEQVYVFVPSFITKEQADKIVGA